MKFQGQFETNLEEEPSVFLGCVHGTLLLLPAACAGALLGILGKVQPRIPSPGFGFIPHGYFVIGKAFTMFLMLVNSCGEYPPKIIFSASFRAPEAPETHCGFPPPALVRQLAPWRLFDPLSTVAKCLILPPSIANS